MLDGRQPIVAVGVHDGLSAALAERAGVAALWVSGFCVTASRAVPDASLLSSRQLVDKVDEIASATSLPLIVDVDEGHGDARSSARLAREVHAAGAAAISIEDNAWPKVNSFSTAQPHRIVATHEFQRKLREIRRAAPGLRIIARTEALIAGLPLRAAVARGTAYASAGADYVLIHSRFTALEQFAAIRDAWQSPTPLAVVPTLATAVRPSEFTRLGFALVIYANHPFRSAAAVMIRAYENITADGTPAASPEGVSMNFLFDVADRCESRRRERKSEPRVGFAARR